MRNLFFSGWVFVILGAVAIGVGSVVATLGWSQLGKASQKKSLILSIAVEWDLNEQTLRECPLFTSEEEDILRSRNVVFAGTSHMTRK